MAAKKEAQVSIVLSGPSSTGKTTIADDWCSKHTEYNRIQEVARDIMKRDNLTRKDLQQSLESDKSVFIKLQEDILAEQNRRELSLSGRPFISDRGLDPLVYIQQQCNEKEMDRFLLMDFTQECIKRYRNCLIVILCPLHIQPCDDGVRLVPSRGEQMEFIKLLVDLLKKLEIPFIYIDECDHTQRMKLLEDAVVRFVPQT